MGDLGVSDDEIRRIAELSMNDREDEAGERLAAIGTRAEDEFRRVMRDEVVAQAKMMICRHQRRLRTMAMVAGVLSGMVMAGYIGAGYWYFHETPPTIPLSMGLTFVCGSFGAYLGWMWGR